MRGWVVTFPRIERPACALLAGKVVEYYIGHCGR